MLIIPAIDLQDGCVVRLVQGRRNKKIYSRDPLKIAKHWVKQGAKILHVVDLDGAMSGSIKNMDSLRQILSGVKVPLEFGGGVRSIETIKILLKEGVARVVLGTRAATDRKFLEKVFDEFGDRVIVSVDAKSGKVMTEGWKSEKKGMDALKFACGLKDMGFKQLIYTDTAKDGMLAGPNISAVKNLLKKSGLNVISSGGISSLEDIRRLKKLKKQGLAGIIIGKALYEGRFTLAQAIKTAR